MLNKQSKEQNPVIADTTEGIPFQVIGIASNVMLRLTFQNQGKAGPEQVNFGNDFATAAPIYKDGKAGVEVVWHKNYSVAHLNKSMLETARSKYYRCKSQHEGREKWLNQNQNIAPNVKAQMEDALKQAETELLQAEIEYEEAQKLQTDPETKRFKWFEGQEFAAL